MKNNKKEQLNFSHGRTDNADELIGGVINEYGEIVRGGEIVEVDNIQFAVPIFSPPSEAIPHTNANENVNVDVVFRDPTAVNSKKGEVSKISNLDLEKIKSKLEFN